MRKGTNTKALRSLLTIVLVIFSIPAANTLAGMVHSGSNPLPSVRTASAASLPVLGIDCSYGTTETIPNATGYPIRDGLLDNSCSWIGDVDGDGALDPLVSDNPSTFAAGFGGGLTLDVRMFTNDPSVSTNGFDITLSYDTRYLNAVTFDDSKQVTTDDTYASFLVESARSIDQTNGLVRLARTISTPIFGNVTLFRVRFDVVGVGLSPITFVHNDIVCGCLTPPSVPHTVQGANVDSSTTFNTLNGGTFNFNVTWTFSPNPAVPGAPLTFGAKGACQMCTGPLSYRWDFSSVDSPGYVSKVDAMGITATVTGPPLSINRVALTVNDTAVPSHFARVVKRMPLSASVLGPTTVPVNTPQSWMGDWIGGNPPYTGTWRFCPSAVFCSGPAVSFTPTPKENNTQSGISYSFAGVYNDMLQVTDSLSPQLRSTSSASASLLLNVTGAPAAFAVAVSSNVTLPSTGQVVRFNATVTYASAIPLNQRSTTFNYLFDFGDGRTAAVGGLASVSITKVYSSTGTFNVRLRAQETRTASTISETGYLTLTVGTPITGDFTYPSGSITSGQSLAFTATSSGGTPPFTYSWDFGDGTSPASGSSPSHMYSASGTYTVTLTITDSSGRTTTVTHTLTVSSSPGNTQGGFPLLLGGIVAALAVVGGVAFLVLKRRKGRRAPPA